MKGLVEKMFYYSIYFGQSIKMMVCVIHSTLGVVVETFVSRMCTLFWPWRHMDNTIHGQLHVN